MCQHHILGWDEPSSLFWSLFSVDLNIPPPTPDLFFKKLWVVVYQLSTGNGTSIKQRESCLVLRGNKRLSYTTLFVTDSLASEMFQKTLKFQEEVRGCDQLQASMRFSYDFVASHSERCPEESLQRWTVYTVLQTTVGDSNSWLGNQLQTNNPLPQSDNGWWNALELFLHTSLCVHTMYCEPHPVLISTAEPSNCLDTKYMKVKRKQNSDADRDETIVTETLWYSL